MAGGASAGGSSRGPQTARVAPAATSLRAGPGRFRAAATGSALPTRRGLPTGSASLYGAAVRYSCVSPAGISATGADALCAAAVSTRYAPVGGSQARRLSATGPARIWNTRGGWRRVRPDAAGDALGAADGVDLDHLRAGRAGLGIS